MVLISCLINVPLSLILMENLVVFIKCLLNFWAHALQLEPNKVWYTNFVKFRLQSMSSKIKQAFKKEKGKMSTFCQLHLYCNLFLQFLLNFKKNILFIWRDIKVQSLVLPQCNCYLAPVPIPSVWPLRCQSSSAWPPVSLTPAAGDSSHPPVTWHLLTLHTMWQHQGWKMYLHSNY